MKKQIKETTFRKEWGDGKARTYFFDVLLEGETKPFNIGAKTKDPDFLTPGKILDYTVVDEARRKIKRNQPQFENKTVIVERANKNKLVADDNESGTSLIRGLGQYKEENIIFIDIETVRGVKKLKENTPLYEAWEYKNRYNNELERKTGEKTTLEEYFEQKAALYPTFGKVVVISVGRIVDNKLNIRSYSVSKETKWDEGKMLKEFNNDVNKVLMNNPLTVFAGWSNFGFDQPYLAKRMIVHGIKPNILLDTNHLKPWEIPGIDLKEQWKGNSFYPDSLLAVAVALGLPSPKSKMDGSEVGDYYYAGKIAQIVEYCENDVRTTANIYRKLVNKSLL